MREQIREAWCNTITPEDYEAHMAAIGQAQANAGLVAEYLELQPPARHASLLFAGAGTGQMFDFVSPGLLLPFNVTFTDINAGFLSRLEARVSATAGLRFATVVDDLEHTTLSRRFDMVIAVLVLEHVDWHSAVATLCQLSDRGLFVVIQENPTDLTLPISAIRTVPETMQVFTRIHPALVPAVELQSVVEKLGFRRSYSAHRLVADGKRMIAFGFCRTPRAPS